MLERAGWGLHKARRVVLASVSAGFSVSMVYAATVCGCAADGALAPLLVETTPVLDPRSSHCNFFRDSGRVLVSPGGVRCHLMAVWVVVSVFVCLLAWLWYPP